MESLIWKYHTYGAEKKQLHSIEPHCTRMVCKTARRETQISISLSGREADGPILRRTIRAQGMLLGPFPTEMYVLENKMLCLH